MNFQDFGNLVIIVVYILLAIFILITMSILFYQFLQSKKAKIDYGKSVLKLLKDKKAQKDLDIKKPIEFLFKNYQSKGNFSNLNFDEINSELIAALRNNSANSQWKINSTINEKDIQLLESIIKEIQEDYMFSDEKSYAILEIIKKSKLTESEKKELTESFKIYFTSILSYSNGRIFEKDQKIAMLEYENVRIKKKKFITSIIGGIFAIIGFVSSILTIMGSMQ